MNRRKVEEIALAVVVVLGILALLAVPVELGALPEQLPSLNPSGLDLGAYSTPILIGLGLLLSVGIAFGLAVLVVRIGAGPTETVAGSLVRVFRAVWPDSPLVRAAALITIGLFVIIAIMGVLPSVIGDPAEADNSPVNFADDLKEGEMNTEWDSIVAGDAVEGTAACAAGDGERPAVPHDADGDGLADSWERNGETPGGAALPDADPNRTDLYVQVNTGSNVDGFSASEREQLRQVWADMPIENPDGSTGVTLHLLVDPPAGGELGSVASVENGDAVTRFYTDEHLGERACVYHQVTLGEVDVDGALGLSQTGGFASVVDGTEQPDYEGDVSFRVALTTHHLLHNVAGAVEGDVHTADGWLAGGPDNEFLSDATTRLLNEQGFATAN